MSGRMFFLPGGAGYVLFDETVLCHMYRHAQTRWFRREAGGQLFSPTPHEAAVMITHATGPYPSDLRRRHGFVPDAALATADRHHHFGEQRHAVGLWHTHPEPYPAPSPQDRSTALAFLDDFRGSMTGFLLVIVGNAGTPFNMTVWLAQAAGRHKWVQLIEA